MTIKKNNYSKKVIEPGITDDFYFANLVFKLKADWVIVASAMPEYEKTEGIIEPNITPPTLWRGWVLAYGPGIYLSKTNNMYFNPGIERHDFVYFKPENGHFFYFNDISFVFVKMSDIEISVTPPHA